jgi:hypothetical protein
MDPEIPSSFFNDSTDPAQLTFSQPDKSISCIFGEKAKL